MKVYNRSNFFKHTFCIFRQVRLEGLPKEKPDYVSKSGSSYYFTADGVFRLSNHWGRAANCKWRLDSKVESSNRNKSGFAYWTDFFPDNEHEKLYWLKVDKQKLTVSFDHKFSSDYNGEFLRTSSQTIKRIREIRLFLEDFSQSDKNSQSILEELIATDKNRLLIQREIVVGIAVK